MPKRRVSLKSVVLCCAVAALASGLWAQAASADVYGGWALNAPGLACCGDTPVGQSFYLQEEIGGGTGIHGDVGSTEIHNGFQDVFQYFIGEHSTVPGFPASSIVGNKIVIGAGSEGGGECHGRYVTLEGTIESEEAMSGTLTRGSYELPEESSTNCAEAKMHQEGTGTWTAYRGSPKPTIAVADTTVEEPFTGTHTAQFPITLSSSSSSAVSVSYETRDGSGAEGAVASKGDYETTAGTVTFNPGETSKTIPVTVKANKTKGKLSFKMALGTPTNATVSRGEASGTITPLPKLSGHVYAMNCGDTSCQQKGLSEQTILVQGKTGDGTAVDESARTDGTGEWAANVPAGSYLAGPTVDGSTIEGPGWDPEKSDPISVGTADVGGIDFRTCGGGSPGGASASAIVHPLAWAKSSAADPYKYLCETTYTFQLAAKIHQKTFVDPAPLAPYATHADGSGFQADNEDPGAWHEKLPECDRFDSRRGKPPHERWLSYYDGNTKLGTATVALNLHRYSAELVDLNSSEKVAPGKVTRNYQFAPAFEGKKECEVTHQVTPIVAALTPGGGRFELVVSWPLPFEARGQEPPKDLEKLPGVSNHIHELIDKAAEEVPGFEKLPKAAKTAIIFVVAHLAEEKGFHAIGHHYPSKAALIQMIESTVAAEKATNPAVLVYNFASAVANEAEGYHPMTMVVRGHFIEETCTDASGVKSVDLCTITTLAQDVSTDQFPDYELRMLRSGKGGGSRELGSASIPQYVAVSSGSAAGPYPGRDQSSIPTSKGGTPDMNELWHAMKSPVEPGAPEAASGHEVSGVPKAEPDCTVDAKSSTLTVTAKSGRARCYGFIDGNP